MSICRTGEENTIKFSQVAYSIGYYPWEKLKYAERRLIVWKRTKLWTKQEILNTLNEEKTEIYLAGEGFFTVHWIFNNIPTEQQWNIWSEDQKFLLSFRISPALNGSTRIVILDLFQPQEFLE